MKKIQFAGLILLMFAIAAVPTSAKADFFDYLFNPFEIIDDITDCDGPRLPFGGCENPSRIYNNVNSNNVNSNVNSPGASVYAPGANTNTGTNFTVPDAPLQVTCYANFGSAVVGQGVVWTASAWGGNGSYAYSWNGTDALSGNSSSISKAYSLSGSKSASVQVISGRQIVNQACGNIIVYSHTNNYNPAPQPVPDPALFVSCSADKTRSRLGETVGWTAYPSGGTGSYSYSWSGTDALGGSGRNTYISYNTSGTKTASVRVTSGNQSTVQSCSNSVFVEQDDFHNDLDVRCYPSSTLIETGERVTWRSDVSGGTGSYRYSWGGTDGLSSSSGGPAKTYTRPGYKTAYVTVTSGSRSVTRDCDRGVDVRERHDYYNPYDPYYPQNPYPYYGNITATCSANVNTVRPGGVVTWTAYPSGGNGRYTYSWTGSDNLRGYNAVLPVQYSITGTKYATVTVYSGGSSTVVLCSNTVNVAYDTPSYTAPKTYSKGSTGTKPAAKQSLDASCSVNTPQARIGDSVVWTATATGGSGTYTYTWNGSDGLYGQGSIAFKSYASTGVKMGAVTISSEKETVTRACLNTVNVEDAVQKVSYQEAAPAYANIPWGMISSILILILIGIIAYLLISRPRL